MDDLKIIKNIKNGDLKTYESVFKQYYEPLCDYASTFIKDYDLAEEIVQDFFYQFWKKREETEITSTLKGYFYQAVKNNCLQYLRHKEVEARYAKSIKKENLTLAYEPENSMEIIEISETIDRTLEELPEKCREIFELSRFQGLKYAEIAQQLSISVKTVEANMGKALKMFRKSLSGYVGNLTT